MWLGFVSSHPARLIWILVLLLAACQLPATAGCKGSQTASLEGERIILVYPTTIPQQCAQQLLEDRAEALRFAEEALDTTLQGLLCVQVELVLLTGPGYAKTDPHLVGMSVPVFSLQPGRLNESQSSAHEEVHIIASQAWGPMAATAIKEGLAVMIDSTRRYPAFVDFHLVCKGLRQLGELFSIQSLLSTYMAPRSSVVSLANLYLGGASFSHFLVQKYGMESYSRFYRVSWKPFALLLQDVEHIYGDTLYALEQEWHCFLDDYAPGQETRAEFAVTSIIDQDPELNARVERLEALWRANPDVIGPSEKAYEAYRAFKDASLKVAGFEALARGGRQAEDDFACYVSASSKLSELTLSWEHATRVFGAVRESIPVEGDEARANMLLVEALSLYAKAGDTAMIRIVSAYLNLQRRTSLRELLSEEDRANLAVPLPEDVARQPETVWRCE